MLSNCVFDIILVLYTIIPSYFSISKPQPFLFSTTIIICFLVLKWRLLLFFVLLTWFCSVYLLLSWLPAGCSTRSVVHSLRSLLSASFSSLPNGSCLMQEHGLHGLLKISQRDEERYLCWTVLHIKFCRGGISGGVLALFHQESANNARRFCGFMSCSVSREVQLSRFLIIHSRVLVKISRAVGGNFPVRGGGRSGADT